MPVNGNGNNSPPSTVVSNLITNGLLMHAPVKRVICVCLLFNPFSPQVYADTYTVPEIVYESNSKSQTTNMKTLPNTPQVDLIPNDNDEVLR